MISPGTAMLPGQPVIPNPQNQHPTIDQLRKLRTIYKRESDAIENLWHDSEIDYAKSYSILSL